MSITTGRTATLEFHVGDDDTAEALGSGDLPVLATPRLLAWAEAATCAAVDGALETGSSSVGTRVQLDHVAASPVGATVTVTATTSYVDGRLLRFEVVAHQAAERAADGAADGATTVVAHGEVTRVVVDRERFLGRL